MHAGDGFHGFGIFGRIVHIGAPDHERRRQNIALNFLFCYIVFHNGFADLIHKLIVFILQIGVAVH